MLHYAPNSLLSYHKDSQTCNKMPHLKSQRDVGQKAALARILTRQPQLMRYQTATFLSANCHVTIGHKRKICCISRVHDRRQSSRSWPCDMHVVEAGSSSRSKALVWLRLDYERTIEPHSTKFLLYILVLFRFCDGLILSD